MARNEKREAFYRLLEYAPAEIQPRLRDLLDSVAFEIKTSKTDVNVQGIVEVLSKVIPVGKGGTGRESIPRGSIPYGYSGDALAISPRFVYDEVQEHLGLGTMSPGKILHIKDDADKQIALESGSAVSYISSDTTGDILVEPGGDELIIGSGVAGVDYTVKFNGETNDGILKWMEDEDYFEFMDDVLMNGTESIFFRDNGLWINSADDGHLDIRADVSIDLKTAADTDLVLNFEGTTNSGVLTWMEDEDYFKFSDDVLIDADEKVYFRDTAIYAQSQADGYLNLVADSGVRVGDGTPTNYTQFDSTGHQTMVAAAKPWDDLRIEPVARTTGANAPTFEKWFDDVLGTSRGVYLYSFDDAVAGSEKEIFFTMQMPHAWDGQPIHMHVHWVGAVSDTTAAPRWGLEYTWKDIGQVFGDTTIVYSDGVNYVLGGTDPDVTAGKHYLSEFADISPGATAANISSVLIGRIFRNSSDAADTYNAGGAKCGMLYIDCHIQINSLGSTDEYTK